MSRNTLVDEIGEWLIDQALLQPDIVEMFEQLCYRLYAVGIPVSRARLTWPTLHPLFRAETILWKRGQQTEFEQFRHQEELSEAWLQSPMHCMLTTGIAEFRRHLDGPNKMVDFPVLEELIQDGFTDYLLIATSFTGATQPTDNAQGGFLLAWSCERAGGFSDDDIAALKVIQRRFAVACKTVVQTRIATNITQTYLGRQAGKKVLDGAIKLGDGEEQKAIVWYSDMRNSTALSDTMPPQEMLDLLRDYFSATAGPVMEFGGDVLDFIGDAVLAVFPYDDDEGRSQAIHMAVMALENAQERARSLNEDRRAMGKVAFQFGVGLTCGAVAFGNIGVEDRLAFTVIGSVVNEVARIESLTKTRDCSVLVSEVIAKAQPEKWQSTGFHCLDGVAKQSELFCFKPDGPLHPSQVLANDEPKQSKMQSH